MNRGQDYKKEGDFALQSIRNQILVSQFLFVLGILIPTLVIVFPVILIDLMIHSPDGWIYWGLWLQPILALVAYLRIRRAKVIDRRVSQLLMLAAIAPPIAGPLAYFAMNLILGLVFVFKNLSPTPWDYFFFVLAPFSNEKLFDVVMSALGGFVSLNIFLFPLGGWLLVASTILLFDSASKSNSFRASLASLERKLP